MYAIIQAPSECIDARASVPDMEAPRIEGSLGRMKLSCLQENLKRGLAIVGHAVAGKSTLPVLSHILLATDDGRLKLAKQARATLKLTVPILLDPMDDSTSRAYGALASNPTYLIGRDGVVVAAQRWFEPYSLRRQIEQSLHAQPGSAGAIQRE